MDNFYSIDVGVLGAGLTNQIGFIITGILYAKLNRQQFVILGDFNCNYNTISYCSIGTIIDLSYLNKYLEKYNIHVIDRTKTSVDIISVKYGTRGYIYDITNQIKDNFMPNGKLLIKKNVYLNDIVGDPAVGSKKFLYVKYCVDGKIATAIYDENRQSDISINLEQVPRVLEYHWIAPCDLDLYDEILKNIRFTKQFYDIAEKYISSLELTPKVNLLHLRDDDNDAINFWSQKNGMVPFEFKELLTKKYIDLIDKYFSPEDNVLVLTGNTNSKVLEYMKEKGYSYHVSAKSFPTGRELNAIVDLLTASACTNTFIGNINPVSLHGSTFSYLIWKRINDNTKKIFIDLDRIKDDEVVLN